MKIRKGIFPATKNEVSNIADVDDSRSSESETSAREAEKTISQYFLTSSHSQGGLEESLSSTCMD